MQGVAKVVEVKAEKESARPSLQEAQLRVRGRHSALALPCQGLGWDEFRGWWMFLQKAEVVQGGKQDPCASGRLRSVAGVSRVGGGGPGEGGQGHHSPWLAEAAEIPGAAQSPWGWMQPATGAPNPGLSIQMLC